MDPIAKRKSNVEGRGRANRGDATDVVDQSLSSSPFLWPLVAAASAAGATAALLNDFSHFLMTDGAEREPAAEFRWATPHRVALELQSLRLRDFSRGNTSVPALICAPFALHGASVVDFAPGHSLVEALCGAGLSRVFVTDWRSAAPEMRNLSIDNYLADMNVVVDELGAPVDLIGLCQGGWMALVFAARFPGKVRRLVLAGAPIDLHAGESELSRLAARVPLPIFEEIVRLGEGRVLGRRVLDLWAPVLESVDIGGILQISQNIGATRMSQIEEMFRDWYATTIDLPGVYYLQVVTWLFKENRLAGGHFVALGRTIDLADVRMPIFMLAARDDELVSTEQLFATARLVGTPKIAVTMATEPCSHLSLFVGAQTLGRAWPRIAQWLARDIVLSQAS